MQNIIKGLKDDYDCWFHINIIVNVSGDLSAKFLHQVQPEKLALTNGILIHNLRSI